MNRMTMALMAGLLPVIALAEAFELRSGQTVNVAIDTVVQPMLASAYEMFRGDLMAVLDADVSIVSKGSRAKQAKDRQHGKIIVEIDPNGSELAGLVQAFVIQPTADGALSITGSDAYGAVYGMMEVSRMLGVSPWEWWADASPRKRDSFVLPADYKTVQSPSVEFRGIFINDEDWGLMPWSSFNYEPIGVKGSIGPRTNERIFQLMMRLRANYYWPAMHECSHPFFLTEGNREMAARYGIYIGGSHCEPMASSTAVEWGKRGVGEYDYVNNSAAVYKFWEDRVKDVSDQPIIYTLGMRGVHDGAMNGAKTIEEQRNVLSRAISDQRTLLSKYVSEDATHVTQVFIPYKEVLDVYNSGLEVPEDVCLMWCDDNYGYIKHFPTEAEAMRKGGNGIYYHVSYWGRPHDYLWLGTFSPYLLYQQMKSAYDHGIQRMWILNVGDIKPAEYQMELFMDMAWNIEAVAGEGVDEHMHRFLSREFGNEVGGKLVPIMNEHYRLAFIHKPEFMGNTRTEEKDPAWKAVKDLPLTVSEIGQRLQQYDAISDGVEALFAEIPEDRFDTYFQLVKYPVQGAAQMNRKHLYAQMARHGMADWRLSDLAYDSIAAMTLRYNEGFHNNGKWKSIMDFKPRRLSVFNKVEQATSSTSLVDEPHCISINGEDLQGAISHPGLGYYGKAAELVLDKTHDIQLPKCESDSVTITLCFLPTHPINGIAQRIAVSVDDSDPVTFDITTQGRSEEWKENVLWNRSKRSATFPHGSRLSIRALDPGLILDEIIIDQ